MQNRNYERYTLKQKQKYDIYSYRNWLNEKKIEAGIEQGNGNM